MTHPAKTLKPRTAAGAGEKPVKTKLKRAIVRMQYEAVKWDASRQIWKKRGSEAGVQSCQCARAATLLCVLILREEFGNV